MAHTLDQVIEKYIKLRDEKASVSARHSEELAGITEQMGIIERWLLQQMDQDGVSSVKTTAGTTYKDIKRSVKMADADAFKRFAFSPLIAFFEANPTVSGKDIYTLLQEYVHWDLVDFQVGKKGVQEFVDDKGTLPPGVSMDTFTTVKIRRA